MALPFQETDMLSIKLICVGRMKEKYYLDAFQEYAKRLLAYCSFECVELPEVRLPENPNEKQITAALEKEAESLKKALPKGAFVVAFCVEGQKFSSPQFAEMMKKCENTGRSRLCFLIGGSYGLAQQIKMLADIRLSISDMTFPHHLARVIAIEQIYRCFKINEGSAYHK